MSSSFCERGGRGKRTAFETDAAFEVGEAVRTEARKSSPRDEAR